MISKSRLALSASGRRSRSRVDFFEKFVGENGPCVLAASRASLGMVLPARHPPPPLHHRSGVRGRVRVKFSVRTGSAPTVG